MKKYHITIILVYLSVVRGDEEKKKNKTKSSIHFAPTILPQDIRVSPNWHGNYERERRKNIII